MKKRIYAALIFAAMTTALCGCQSTALPPSTSNLESAYSSSRTSAIPVGSDSNERVNPIAEDEFTVENVSGGVRITSYNGESSTVNIPETINGKKVVSLRDMNFGGLNADIRSVHIPAGVTEMNLDDRLYVFSENFSKITVDEGNTKYYAEDGVLYSKEDNVLLMYPCGKEGGSFVIPDGVTAVGTYAFNNAKKLTEIVVPESVTELREGAFNNCVYLDAVNIPSGVKELTHYVFGGCGPLSTLVIPEDITKISGLTFSYSDWIDDHCDENGLVIVNGILIDGEHAKGDLVIPENVKEIALYAFGYNEELKSVVIPETVTSIGISAFSECSALESAVIPDTLKFTDIDEWFFRSDNVKVQYKGKEYTHEQ